MIREVVSSKPRIGIPLDVPRTQAHRRANWVVWCVAIVVVVVVAWVGWGL